MDSAFLHILDALIQRVRVLKLKDFAEQDENEDEYQAHDGHIHPELNPNPPLLLVRIAHELHSCVYENHHFLTPPLYEMIVIDIVWLLHRMMSKIANRSRP
jgi:hypothetical protein